MISWRVFFAFYCENNIQYKHEKNTIMISPVAVSKKYHISLKKMQF